MSATFKESALFLKVTFGGLVAPFPQSVSVPGLKVGDLVLSLTTNSGTNITGTGGFEGVVTVDDEFQVTGPLDSVDPYTVILIRI